MTPNDFLLIKNATGVDIKPNSRLIELVSVIREVRKTKKFDIERALLPFIEGSYSRGARWIAVLLLETSLADYRVKFTKVQADLLKWSNPLRVGSIGPESLFERLCLFTVNTATEKLANLIFLRHRLAAGIKYRMNRTKAWVLIEDDGLVRRYDPVQGVTYNSYRESRVNNCIDLLEDLALIKEDGGIYRPTQEGCRWLHGLK